MMGDRTVMQEALFYNFSIEEHVPADHLLRSIARFIDLGGLREHLRPYYSETGRPPIDPELMIRMLIIGYCMGIRSERRLCEEVRLDLAYRWFCRLGLEGGVPDHSTFSRNRHGRFRDGDLLRRLFEMTVERCTIIRQQLTTQPFRGMRHDGVNGCLLCIGHGGPSAGIVLPASDDRGRPQRTSALTAPTAGLKRRALRPAK